MKTKPQDAFPERIRQPKFQENKELTGNKMR